MYPRTQAHFPLTQWPWPLQSGTSHSSCLRLHSLPFHPGLHWHSPLIYSPRWLHRTGHTPANQAEPHPDGSSTANKQQTTCTFWYLSVKIQMRSKESSYIEMIWYDMMTWYMIWYMLWYMIWYDTWSIITRVIIIVKSGVEWKKLSRFFQTGTDVVLKCLFTL